METELKKAFFCRRCHKPLTDARSIQRGIGPLCWKIILAEMETNAFDHVRKARRSMIDEERSIWKAYQENQKAKSK